MIGIEMLYGGLFAGVGILVVLTYTLGHNVFYSFILKSEMSVKKKVREDINKEIKKHKEIIKKKGSNEFINNLILISKIEQLLSEGKGAFERWIIWANIGMVVFLMLYLFQSSTNYLVNINPEIFGYLFIGCFLALLYKFNFLNTSKKKIEDYLSGISVKEIFDEDEIEK